MEDPSILETRRLELIAHVARARKELSELRDAYAELPNSGLLLDTEGIGALTTPAYCVAGAREVLEEASIELDAAADALDRAGTYTSRLRTATF
ncbi:hypothetical protein [Nocardia bovistercoris]|uniref:hypothetical protein n=1 Tax=Nocardia bovistercoris TaxID=2785916 RepID=UPI002FCD166B